MQGCGISGLCDQFVFYRNLIGTRRTSVAPERMTEAGGTGLFGQLDIGFQQKQVLVSFDHLETAHGKRFQKFGLASVNCFMRSW